MSGHKPKERKKRIMRAFKINEISGVDRPAQEPAKSLIMKRNDLTEAIQQANKASAEKSVKGALTTEDEGHTHLVPLQFGDMEMERSGHTSHEHDHSHPWVMMEDGTIVIGAVFNHTHGVDVVGKREFSAEERERLVEGGQAMPGGAFPIVNESDLKNAIQAFGRAKDKPATARHIKRRAKALGLTDMLPEEGKLADLLSKKPAKATEKAGDPGQFEENHMTDNTHSAEVQQLKDELAKAKKLALLGDVHKAHYRTLGDNEGEDFLMKSASERDLAIEEAAKAAKAADPIVYTALDGTEVRKSMGDAVLAMIKKADATEKENVELKKKAEREALVKRAETDLAHLPGSVDVRIEILKAVDGIVDDETRKSAHAALKAQDGSMSKSFVTEGHTGQPEAVKKSADAELDELAKAYQKEHNVDYYKAYSAVLNTPQGQEIYAKAVG